MRTREEIEKQVKSLSEEHVYSDFTRLTLRDNINLELLLDIREILEKIGSSKFVDDFQKKEE